MAAGRSSTGISPRPMLMGAPRNAIVLSVHLRPQVATPVSRPGFVARLFGRGPVLRTCNRVMAHRPIGSTQTDRIRLPYAARRLSLSRNNKALSACKNIPFPICCYGTTNSP